MSRDGYLPPGCTQRDVDMAQPGYFDEPPCEERPKLDDEDVCLYCGADPTQACQWRKP